ncbi:hypothetical protein H5410_016198 [Solanum commersonii]|uniref:Uncharacterized protein n=1 Tax=Solanum commersonii TaxID=4109 RepID=A0A9J5ZVR5_SOLCO|nr:hypothetical protein H5410_016198 [Solanum commersonii]
MAWGFQSHNHRIKGDNVPKSDVVAAAMVRLLRSVSAQKEMMEGMVSGKGTRWHAADGLYYFGKDENVLSNLDRPIV